PAAARGMRTNPAGKLMDVGALAARLNVSVRYVRRLVAERRVPYIKFGRLLRFDPDEIEGWLDRARIEEALPPRSHRRRAS
ncbi:MAG: helix-turn-helix domain-containing protein, partial [Acidimicrobiales bacterium]